MTTAGWLTRTDTRIQRDPRRVLARLFVPGEELPSDASRASPIINRILGLDAETAAAMLADVMRSFDGRHPDLPALLHDHFDQVRDRIAAGIVFTADQEALLGAYFTAEYAVEAAAVCNPSMVAHPDQSGLSAGDVRFVLSLRGVGEGHISSIQFRTGVVSAGRVDLDAPTGRLRLGRIRSATLPKDRVAGQLRSAGYTGEIVTMILGRLPDALTDTNVEAVISSLHEQVLGRKAARAVIDALRTIVATNYDVEFPPETSIDERILFPHGPSESHGMEDARFVRFVRPDGTATYYATYTAYDGAHIAPQLLQTDDFTSFAVSQLTGPGATNKGLALFPRTVGGRYAALSRWDRESNALTMSDDGRRWEQPVNIRGPERPWELVQIGNCGSPIETPEGWLVLTHGVGPMRTYSIGAMLLDLDEPWKLRGALAEPLMVPGPSERNGYVPNVLYSCGSMLHEGTVVLPFAWSDIGTSVALVDLAALLDGLLNP